MVFEMLLTPVSLALTHLFFIPASPRPATQRGHVWSISPPLSMPIEAYIERLFKKEFVADCTFELDATSMRKKCMSNRLQVEDRAPPGYEDRAGSPESVPDVLFRRLMASFATGVTVITARDVDDAVLGFTANAVSSVSRVPPLILVCASHALFTLGAIRRSGYFAVNFMDEGSEKIVRRFGGRGGDKFDGIDTETGMAGLPLLKNSLAVAECETYKFTEAGDHTIIFGRVVGGRVSEARYPLLYYRGEFSSWNERSKER